VKLGRARPKVPANPFQPLPRYEPSAGRVELNGRGVRTVTLAELRRAVAYVPQDAGLVRGTVLHNIRYGAVPTPNELDGERAEEG
jgi:ABC-type multidrug transport system fused ATPase/permease subunit